jgi:hypothetical protein
MPKDRPKWKYKANVGERKRLQEKSMENYKEESKKEKDERLLKNKKSVLGRFHDKSIKKKVDGHVVDTELKAKKAKIGRVKRVDW